MFSTILPVAKLIVTSPVTRVVVTRAATMFAVGTTMSIGMDALGERIQDNAKTRTNNQRLAVEALGLKDLKEKIEVARETHRNLDNAVLNATIRTNDVQQRKLAKTARDRFRDTQLRPLEAEFNSAVKKYLKENQLPLRTRYIEAQRRWWRTDWQATKRYFRSGEWIAWAVFSIGYGLGAAGKAVEAKPFQMLPNMDAEQVDLVFQAAEPLAQKLYAWGGGLQLAGFGGMLWGAVAPTFRKRSRRAQEVRLGLRDSQYDEVVNLAINDEIDLDAAVKARRESPLAGYRFRTTEPTTPEQAAENRKNFIADMALFLSPLESLRKEEQESLTKQYRDEVTEVLQENPLEVPERLLDVTSWAEAWCDRVLRPDNLPFTQALSLILHGDTHPTVISKHRPNRKEFFRILDEKVRDLARSQVNA